MANGSLDGDRIGSEGLASEENAFEHQGFQAFQALYCGGDVWLQVMPIATSVEDVFERCALRRAAFLHRKIDAVFLECAERAIHVHLPLLCRRNAQ